MNAFITGSQAYGYPSEGSDLDLVILVTKETAKQLIEHSDNGKLPVRYGKLNIVLVYTAEEYNNWLKAKVICEQQKSITREQAVAVHIECGVLRKSWFKSILDWFKSDRHVY